MKTKNSNDWLSGLKFIQYMKNTTYHPGMNKTPYEAMFGFSPQIVKEMIVDSPEEITPVLSKCSEDNAGTNALGNGDIEEYEESNKEKCLEESEDCSEDLTGIGVSVKQEVEEVEEEQEEKYLREYDECPEDLTGIGVSVKQEVEEVEEDQEETYLEDYDDCSRDHAGTSASVKWESQEIGEECEDNQEESDDVSFSPHNELQQGSHYRAWGSESIKCNVEQVETDGIRRIAVRKDMLDTRIFGASVITQEEKTSLEEHRTMSIECSGNNGNSLNMFKGTVLKTYSRKRPIEKIVMSGTGDPSVMQTHVDRPDQSVKKKNVYKCGKCNNTFTDQLEFFTHLKTHKGKKTYVCSVCQKVFSYRSCLELHFRSHSGERPFECSTCKKAFSRLSHLKTHHRVHTGEKPYQCEVCKKRYAKLCNLRTHRRIHTGDKPFACEVCKDTFSDRSALDAHREIHCKEESHT